MKVLKLCIAFFVILAGILSCQKELEFDLTAPSEGELKKDALGNCFPSPVSGIYKADNALTGDNFIDVSVELTTVGTYTISSDTVNGFSFRGTGTLGILGTNIVRLYGSGKPVVAGLSSFTISYGTSSCVVDVTVLGATAGNAVYTLGGAPGACSGFTLGSGSYNAGQVLVAANTAQTNVNVSAPGVYDLGTDTVNGIYFRVAGSFSTLGVQSITLHGHGTPLASGNFVYTLNTGSTSCSFSVTVGGGAPAAVYSLGGAPGSCTGTVLSGTYKEGQALVAGNTVKVDVTVTTAGTYSMSTTANNGVTFSASGTFSATGVQTVTLTGSGTPTGFGVKTHTINGASTNSCSFNITYDPSVPPGSFVLGGGPGNCAPITVNGTYELGTALTAANTAVVQVNVITPGAYTITTGLQGGMTFSASGVFAAAGVQSVTLQGTGTPTKLGVVTMTPQVGTSSCTFDITVMPPPDVIKCKIDGVLKLFNADIIVQRLPSFPPGELVIASGAETVGATIRFGIAVNNANGPVTPGDYDLTSNPPVSITLNWGDYIGQPAFQPDVKVKVTVVSATRFTGTFSGTIRNNLAGISKLVTEGVFDVAF